MSESIEARLAALEAEVHELRDREAIRDVLYRYCRAADRLDLELLKSCYWPDGHDTHWFYNGNAHEFAEHAINDVLPFCIATEHSISNPIIEISGDRAFVESRVRVMHKLPLGDRPERLEQDAHCRYIDLFEKRDGEWRIHYRHCAFDASRDFEVPDLLSIMPAESLGKHGTDDQAYAGFELETLRPAPARMEDLWAPLLAVHGVMPQGAGASS